jgi:CHASE2 domain-containing sensor protein
MNTSSQWKKRRRHIRPLALMFLFLAILVIPELDNAWTSNPCALQESEQGWLSTMVYGTLSSWAFSLHNLFHKELDTPVTIVYINPQTDPTELLTNTCLARDFLAGLVTDVVNQGAKAIVIDKYYSYGSCSNDKKNENFRTILNENAKRVPIVVGQPTKLLAYTDKAKDSCLTLAEPFDFGPFSQVKYGLTRLNSDVLKIPLRWPVFKDRAHPKDVLTADGSGDSLSLVAAENIEPGLIKDSSFQSFLALNKHPYTSFRDLPSTTAMTVRCDAEQQPTDADGNGLPCTKARNPSDGSTYRKPDLKGQIVVIGDLSDQDMQPFPDANKEEPGVFLQANYVKSILDQRFLREVPFFITFVGFILFIIAVYCLHLFLPEQAFLVSSISLFAILIVSFVTLMAFHYYTPLWALSGAAVFVVIRFLETKAHDYGHQATGENSHPLKSE